MLRYLLFVFPLFVQAQEIQLAPPRIICESPFFTDSARVSLDFRMENSTIWYARDYRWEKIKWLPAELYIRNGCTLQAKVTHPEFLESDVVRKSFIKVNYSPDRQFLFTLANKDYPGKGALTLFDLKKGSNDFHDGNWLGFAGDTARIEAQFAAGIRADRVIISSLFNSGAWIYPMRKVVVQGQNHKGQWVDLGLYELNESDLNASPAGSEWFKIVPLKKMKTKKFRIVIYPYGPLPKDHPGAGSPAWLFLDEIIFQ